MVAGGLPSSESYIRQETSDNTTVIIAAAVGGLLLLAVVAGVAIVMKKRGRPSLPGRKNLNLEAVDIDIAKAQVA